MISKAELKKDFFMKNLTDEMLEKIVSITQVIKVQSGEVIFNEGDSADNFYMVKSGKVLLEQKISDDIMVTVGAIEAGEDFGLSVLLNEDACSMSAICNEAAVLYAVHRQSIIDLMESDHSMGYLIMKQAASVLDERLRLRTEQFLRSLKSHPEIHELDYKNDKEFV